MLVKIIQKQQCVNDIFFVNWTLIYEDDELFERA